MDLAPLVARTILDLRQAAAQEEATMTKRNWLLRYRIGEVQIALPAGLVGSTLTLARRADESDAEYAAAVAMFDSMVLGFVRVVAETPEKPVQAADDDVTVHRGSGDFLADQSYENPDLTRTKFFIAHCIAGMLEKERLSPLDASMRYGVDLGLLTAVSRGLADDCPLDGLIDALKAMGKNVVVVVSDAAEKTGILWATTTESDH
ncbi:XRE family transcriptional regulator [Bradyrhizobium sp.]